MTPIAAALSLFFLLLALVASSADPHIGDCVPKSCGTVTNITYPFWVTGHQPSYCGFPEFKLKCEDDTPSLQTPNGVYQVRSISYHDQSIHVAPSLPDVGSPNTDCPIYHNLTFTSTPFNVRLTNWELLLVQNCTKPSLPLDRYAFSCGGYERFSILYYSYGFLVPFALPAPCEVAVLPVLESPGAKPSDYATLINDGFLLNWTAADCSDCKESGGDCGYDSTNKTFMCICEDRVHSRSCTEPPKKKKNNIVKILIGVGGGGGLLAVFVVCCLWYNRGKIMRQSSSSSKFLIRAGSASIKGDQEMGSNSYQTHVFSYNELHEATNGFDESRELGDGGFGTVYKGNLRDGRVVAVKRLYENNFKRVEQFLNEVDILSRLRHPNLVTLYGCTSRHSRELLLVYEFVSNGTVADHLHGPRVPDNGLTWPIRLSIAIETAEALAYLHAAETQIIHRDVKTTNILLDSNFHVKVADFGLSRLFPMDATHVSTLPQGTPGYVDPEYHQCYQLTDKSDVYSFGVVLVELISSMPAVDISRHRHEINLANLAINKIQNREVEQLVDPRLANGDWEIQRMTNMVAEVAFRCLQAEKEMRPSIKEVLEELRRIQGGGEKVVEAAEIGDDARLLKNEVPFSPDTVTDRWESRETTPNTSA